VSLFANLAQDLIASDPRRSAWVSSRMPEPLAEKLGRRKALHLFREASTNVPAYRAFLDARGVDAAKITDFAAFQALPLIDKENYLVPHRTRPADLCVGGRLGAYHAVSRSSGYSGEPLYLPRNERQETAAMRGLEMVWANFFGADRRSTLVLICFDLGMWIAGEMAADVSRELAKKHGSLTITTPGSDVDESIAVIRNLAHEYEQIVIVGYPPFLRQLIVAGEQQGVAWSELDVFLLPSGEGYSERWRSHMLERLGSAGSLTNVVGAFGSSEGHMIGLETPLSILIRRLAAEDAGLRRDLFGDERDGVSLVQHSPMGLLVEIIDEEIVITTSGAAPLTRYNTHDRAVSISFEHVMSTLAAHGYDSRRLQEAGLDPSHVWRMPFLHAFGRQDCVSVDGANIFVEGVAPALLEPGMEGIHNWKLAVRERDDGRLRFVVLVEHGKEVPLEPSAGEDARRRAHYHRAFVDQLLRCNPDFKSAHKNNPDCLDPEVLLYRFGEGPFKGDSARAKQQHVFVGDL